MSIRRRFNIWLINKLRPFKHNKLKSKLFNRIPGCSIGKNSILVGPIFINGCNVNIGSNVHIGHDFKCEGNGQIAIGDCCDVGPNVTLLTGSHEIGNKNRRAGRGQTLSITIFEGCWIGANSIILGKVNSLFIGPSSVVGCASNVVKNVERDSVVAGNPATIIKKVF